MAVHELETLDENLAIKQVLILRSAAIDHRRLRPILSGWSLMVTEVSGLDEALIEIQQSSFDVILLEWTTEGRNFCHAFRSMEGMDYGYIMACDGPQGPVVREVALRDGADALVEDFHSANLLLAHFVAADRLIRTQRALEEKNRIIAATLAELQQVHDDLDNDLMQARKLQEALVKDKTQTFGQIDIALMLRSAGHVGGDLVGTFEVNDDLVGIYGIDVSGHGITSALMTARLAGYLAGRSPETNVALMFDETGAIVPKSPADAVAEMNNLVLHDLDTENYFTLFLGILNTKTGLMTAVQAGHPHPAIQRADGSITFEGQGGLPVGLIPGADFEDVEVSLSPGDRMLILSDGVTECPGRDEYDMLGDEGLSDMLSKGQHLKGHKVFDDLVWRLADFHGKESFPDDVSGILIEFRP